jgi:hypothetical protein
MFLETTRMKLSLANGTSGKKRSNVEGDAVVSQNLQRFYQKVSENDAFSIVTPVAGVTLAATHAVATLGATATPVVTIMNGGTTAIVVNKAIITTLSGTPAAGAWWWAQAQSQSANTFTLLTDAATQSFSMRTGVTDAPSSVRVGVNKALTGLVGNLVPFKIVSGFNTVTASLGNIVEETDGSVVVLPGAVLCLMAPAAGTTHVVQVGVEIVRVEL